MPRQAPARSTRPRSRKAPEVFTDAPLDEKHALILAHAEQRLKHPPGNVFGMYLGVAVCAILVLVGWAIALPNTLAANGSSNSDAAIQAIQKNGAALGQTFSGDVERIKNAEKNTENLLNAMKEQSAAANK